jgi:hypothetical protein
MMEIDLSLKNRVTFLTLSGVNYTGYIVEIAE